MRRSTSALLVVSTLLALAGCKSSCRELSERFCDCVDQYARPTCLTNVAQRESDYEPTDADLAVCEQKLKLCKINENDRNTCDLKTDEDKENCGLAR